MSAAAHKATRATRPAEVQRHWWLVDAEDRVLGRLAARIASVLRGKHKPGFTPHVDAGDFVVVVNAEKVRLTGRKLEQKTYYRHSGWPGGLKQISAGRILSGPHPDRVLRNAVRGMLPKNSLGRKMLGKLKVYAGPEHPHQAQQPEAISL